MSVEEEIRFQEAEVNPDKEEDLKPRRPVVTIMGHVDHGKTSILDYIRESRVASGEHGGITQHIGAYEVKWKDNGIVFMDTPGHAAFTKMRARGASATDIVIIVVAADDGIMPQTKEAISHAKSSGVPMIVAINKIDLPGSNPPQIKQRLLEEDIMVTDFGGDVEVVELSAKTGEGIEDLLERIMLVSEMSEFKANPDKSAAGVIVEARVDKGRGPVATVLIKAGTLKQGNAYVCGSTWGRVRAMFDFTGKKIEEAIPSTPVEILGFNSVPRVGDDFQVVESEAKARDVAEFRQQQEREEELKRKKSSSLDQLFGQLSENEVVELPLIIKTDTQGSIEAIEGQLTSIVHEKIKIKVVHSAVGGITDNDVLLAKTSKAIILGFHVKAPGSVQKLAKRDQVDMSFYHIIYQMVDDVKKAMAGKLGPQYHEVAQGRAEIREVFRIPKVGLIAGCIIKDGFINRKSHLRIYRDDLMIGESKVSTLKRFKDDVSEVKTGYECGIGIANFQDVKEGDEIEAYNIEEKAAVIK